MPKIGGGPLTPAEFKSIREELGLSIRWLAERWGVQERVIQRWENHRIPPVGCAEDLLDLRDTADAAIETGIRDHAPLLTVPRIADAGGFPAPWHRHIAISIAAETGATLDWVKVDA